MASEMRAGYACDEHAGILFTNGEITDVVSSRVKARSYFVSRHKRNLQVDSLDSRILLRQNALDTTAYRRQTILKQVDDFTVGQPSMHTPLLAFVCVQNLFAEGQDSKYKDFAASSIRERVKDLKDWEFKASRKASILSTTIVAQFEYDDFAAILSKGKSDFYSLWYFFKENGEWKCGGEDVGGNTPEDAEITFREKAPLMVKAIKDK